MGKYTNLVERTLEEAQGKWLQKGDQYAFYLDDPDVGKGDRYSVYDKEGKLIDKIVLDKKSTKDWKPMKGKGLPFKSAEGLTQKALSETTLTEGKKEYAIWGVKPGDKDESLLLAEPNGNKITDENIAKKFKKWCEDKGATKVRIQEIDYSTELDFVGTIK